MNQVLGLHSKDTERLIKILKELRDIGNTVIVVEHDEEIMEQANQIIDIGPGAGIHGGEIIFQGPLKEYLQRKKEFNYQIPFRRIRNSYTKKQKKH